MDEYQKFLTNHCPDADPEEKESAAAAMRILRDTILLRHAAEKWTVELFHQEPEQRGDDLLDGLTGLRAVNAHGLVLFTGLREEAFDHDLHGQVDSLLPVAILRLTWPEDAAEVTWEILPSQVVLIHVNARSQEDRSDINRLLEPLEHTHESPAKLIPLLVAVWAAWKPAAAEQG